MVAMNNIDLGHLQITTATNFFSRARGLIGRPKLIKNQALWIAPCDSVHTCFMGGPIDVVFIGADEVIIRVDHSLKPWRFAVAMGGLSVLELAAGEARALGLRVGCRLVRPQIKRSQTKPRKTSQSHQSSPSSQTPKAEL